MTYETAGTSYNFSSLFQAAIATAAVIIVWAKRAWFGVQIVCLAAQAWGFVRRFQRRKLNMEALGIKETLEVIDLGLLIGGAVTTALKDDGKITFSDVPAFGPALFAVAPALDNVQAVVPELKDLDDKELAEIKNHIESRIPDIGVKWLVVAKESLNIGVSAYKLVAALRKEPTDIA